MLHHGYVYLTHLKVFFFLLPFDIDILKSRGLEQEKNGTSTYVLIITLTLSAFTWENHQCKQDL